MELNLTPTQHRFLKELVGAAGAAGAAGAVLLKDLKTRATAADREPLVREGLIEAGEKRRPATFTLTEKGQAWIETHPEPPKVPRAPKPRVPKLRALKPPPRFPDSRQRLFLLRLAFMPPDSSIVGIAGLLKPAERAPLKKEKWIEERRQKKTIQFDLTDAGWRWVEEHLGDPIGAGGLADSTVSNVLACVHTFLTANGLRLADLIRAKQVMAPPPAGDPPPAPAQDGNIRAAIRSACLRLGGRNGQRIRLAALREELNGWSRAEVDQALLDLSYAEDLVLVRMDNPQEMNQEDRDAVFKTPSGEDRHLAYWTRN